MRSSYTIDNHTHRSIVIGQRFAAEALSHGRGLGKRHRVEMNRPRFVWQRDSANAVTQGTEQMQSTRCQHLGPEFEPAHTVVVARNADYRQLEIKHQSGERVIEKRHSVRGRHCAVINISANENRVRASVSG
jgi:hypothetical protein